MFCSRFYLSPCFACTISMFYIFSCTIIVADCFVEGVAYAGDPVYGTKNFHIENVMRAADCQQRCVENDACNFWTWNSPRFRRKKNTCWLKAGKGDIRSKTGKVSGPKICKCNWCIWHYAHSSLNCNMPHLILVYYPPLVEARNNIEV